MKGESVMDLKLELRAVRIIVRWFEQLDEGARRRVLDLLNEKFGTPAQATGK